MPPHPQRQLGAFISSLCGINRNRHVKEAPLSLEICAPIGLAADDQIGEAGSVQYITLMSGNEYEKKS